MKSKFAPSSASLQHHRRATQTGATLALSLTMVLWCGIAQAAPRRPAQPVATEGKTFRDAKTSPPIAQERRRLLTFNERFYPGAIRTFTTWW